MVDFIVAVAHIGPLYTLNSFNPFEWKELQFYPKFKNGFLKGFESEYKGLRIALYYDKIEISNSIHKFYKGNNFSDFTFSELSKAIKEICQKFEISAECWEIKKLEFGFNISTLKPAEQYLKLFLSYKLREFENIKHRVKDYGRKCFYSEYALKVYDKHFQTKIIEQIDIPKNILRIEFCYNQKRKLPKSIMTFSDLLNRDKFRELYNDLKQAFEKVVYNDEVDFTNATNEEITLFYASLHPDFIKVKEEINKVETKATKKKIKVLKERFLKRNFRQWFIKALSSKYIELYCS